MSRRIFDAHCDTALRLIDPAFDASARSEQGHVDVPRLLAGGVGCQVFACFVSEPEQAARPVERAAELMAAVRALERDPRVVFPRSAAELAALAAPGDRVGALLAIEGGEAIGDDPAALERLKRDGVRYITLAWNDNALGGCSLGDGRGLSPLGREMVAEMGRQRMLVDVSHASDATLADILDHSRAPVIASHANARALCDSPRNLGDASLRRIADRGGVIGVFFVASFLTEEARQREAPLVARYRELARRDPAAARGLADRASADLAGAPLPPLAAVADQIEHLIDVAGVDAVGFGGDFDGFLRGPAGLRDCSDYPAVIELLRRRGSAPSTLDKICWDNWQRVFAWTFD
ncbi:MAG: dipeptidase [Deltaproteobacteria bacterium]|nr:dipeptidase [Deltaproteobacteria bacterium]